MDSGKYALSRGSGWQASKERVLDRAKKVLSQVEAMEILYLLADGGGLG